MLGQALHHDPLEPLRQLRTLAAQRGWRILDVHARQLEPVVRAERDLACRGLVERDAQRVKVDALIEGPSLRLFR